MSKNYFEDCKAAVKTMLYPDLQPGKTLPEGKLEEFLDMMLMARDEWRNNINRVMPYNFAGMICSVKDLDVVNSIAPHMLKVCPGIGKNKGQHRTVDPAEAKNLGADYIVVGRTITQSEFPRDTAIKIKESLV